MINERFSPPAFHMEQLVARTLNIVFSQPPASATDEDFNEWYDAHLGEMLAIKGIAAAERYRLETVVEPEGLGAYRYLAVFELEAEPAAVWEEQVKAGLTTRQSYIELKQVDDSGPPLPAWWDDVQFAAWTCVPIGERVEASS
jgi:hypothetical protein